MRALAHREGDQGSGSLEEFRGQVPAEPESQRGRSAASAQDTGNECILLASFLRRARRSLGRLQPADRDDLCQSLANRILEEGLSLESDEGVRRACAILCQLRKGFRRRRAVATLDEWDPPSAAADPQELVAAKEACTRLWEALRRLPAASHQLLSWRYLEGRSLGDTAALARMTAAATEHRLRAAREKLARLLVPRAPSPLPREKAEFSARGSSSMPLKG